MKLIVGLGNPGDNYKDTRHNIGFKAVEHLADRFNFPSFKSKFNALLAEGVIEGEKILLLKPITYMNNSGTAVNQVVTFYKLALSDIIVFHDDLDLPTAKVRVKIGGGHGGHNGLRSIDSHLGKEYLRVRIGIGHPGDKDLVSSYVLHKFSKHEMQQMDNCLDLISDNIGYLLKQNTDLFMNKLALETK